MVSISNLITFFFFKKLESSNIQKIEINEKLKNL